MKKCLAALCLLLLLLSPCALGEETLSAAIDTTLDTLDLSPLLSFLGELFPDEMHLRACLKKLASGQEVISAGALVGRVTDMLAATFKSTLHSMALIFLPAVVLGVMERMETLFSSRSFQLAQTGCYLSLCAMMAKDLVAHLRLCENTVLRMADAMQALFPLLLTLLTAVGGTAGASLYQPALTAAGGTMITFVRAFTLKLALGYGAVTLLDTLSDRMRLASLAALLRRGAAWTLGIAFTLFLSVTALQGVTSAVRDGVSIRAAKYAVDHFVPVVGGMFADTMDALIGSALLVKNALGLTGLAGLVLVSLGPLVQTLCAAFAYRACAALLEILSPGRLCRCIGSFASVLTLFFVIQLSVGAMFFLLSAQLLAAGNLIVMLR